MSDFLLELRSEEIPARMQDKARAELERLFTSHMVDTGHMTAGEVITYATPRRLVLIARDMPEASLGGSQEIKGPRTSAPEQALEGFLRKSGLTKDQLVERDGVWFATLETPGRTTIEALAERIPAIIRAFSWPKSMRWGAASQSTESLRWVRPLQGIVALFGDDVVEFEVAGVRSGAATVGHRFHHPGTITIGSAADYVEKLRACHVVVDQAERRVTIALGAKMAANKAGLTLIEDEGLLIENAGLTEWPVPLLGRFDEAFLDVPPEVIQLTARVNQKYFVCSDAAGKLANAFVCTANIDAADGGAKIVEGNQKVLAARLSDARFFYETDLKVPLEEQAKKLEKIVFHEKLGTVADKVERVARLARWLVEERIVKGADPAQAERAARLAKADLVTGMVGEFPELQGLMGGYYAAAQGEDAAVAEAIRDHYKPVGQGDDVPTAPVTVAVSLADKLDTIVGFFAIQEKPTGSKDPFALRRAALGIVRTLIEQGIRAPFGQVLPAAMLNLVYSLVDRELYRAEFFVPTEKGTEEHRIFSSLHDDEAIAAWQADRGKLNIWRDEGTFQQFDGVRSIEMLPGSASIPAPTTLAYGVSDFFADRLKVQQREAGVRHDLIDAVFALGGEDDLVRLLARVHALQAFMATDDGANLLAGYKRAANILKKEGYGASDPARHPGPVPGSTAPQATASREEGWTPEQVRGDDGGLAALGYTPEPAEAALIAALDGAEPKAAAAVEGERFEEAMAALATLRAPIDAFFTDVTVNDADPAKRESRLALLARMRDAVHRVADFGKIEG